MNEVNALRKQIEREYLEKVALEDEILEKMRTQLTMDKASKYTVKLTHRLRERTKDLVRLISPLPIFQAKPEKFLFNLLIVESTITFSEY